MINTSYNSDIIIFSILKNNFTKIKVYLYHILYAIWFMDKYQGVWLGYTGNSHRQKGSLSSSNSLTSFVLLQLQMLVLGDGGQGTTRSSMKGKFLECHRTGKLGEIAPLLFMENSNGNQQYFINWTCLVTSHCFLNRHHWETYLLINTIHCISLIWSISVCLTLCI